MLQFHFQSLASTGHSMSCEPDAASMLDVSTIMKPLQSDLQGVNVVQCVMFQCCSFSWIVGNTYQHWFWP